MRVNLKELAGQLGLSQTTVSRALNGYPEVNADTRARVNEAAARLGYRPNASARRLATGRAGAVGIVYTASEGFGPHTSEFLGGLGTRLARAEVDILVSTVDTLDEELSSYRRIAASKKVDAIVMHNPLPRDVRMELLLDLGLPFVLHGRSETSRPIAWLDIDNAEVTRRATRELAALGHRRIGLVNGPRQLTYAQHRLAGYREALGEAALPFDEALVSHGTLTDEAGFRQAQTLLAMRPRPTAILAGSMMTALGIFRAIRAAGMTLGVDVSMIAHDDVFPYLNADNMVPAMSTTRSSIRAAGARIAELILEMLAGRPADKIAELWPIELVLRESAAPPA
jgi:LacI family transcriptional regulator